MKKMRWGWILLGGFLAELGVFALAIPPSLLLGQESLLYTAPPASFIATFLLALWAASKKVHQHRVLHGTLIGVVAMLIYIGMTWGQTVPVAYIVAHVLKVLGGAAGGLVAAIASASGGR